MQAIALIVTAAVLVLLAFLALLRIAVMRLESPLGLARDGLPEGSIAPVWRLADTNGQDLLVAHTLPAMALWTVAGLLLAMAPAPVMLAIATPYALFHGVTESLGLPFRAPSASWQVPAEWVKGRSPATRIAIWGATLGPGLFTRNPYAGMWLVIILLAGTGTPGAGAAVGAAVGLLHGSGRAIGVMRNVHHTNSDTAAWDAILAHARWRFVDGVALLLAAATLASLLVWR